jgi:hypothetical protein
MPIIFTPTVKERTKLKEGQKWGWIGDLNPEHSTREMDNFEYTNLVRGPTIVKAG